MQFSLVKLLVALRTHGLLVNGTVLSLHSTAINMSPLKLHAIEAYSCIKYHAGWASLGYMFASYVKGYEDKTFGSFMQYLGGCILRNGQYFLTFKIIGLLPI